MFEIKRTYFLEKKYDCNGSKQKFNSILNLFVYTGEMFCCVFRKSTKKLWQISNLLLDQILTSARVSIETKVLQKKPEVNNTAKLDTAEQFGNQIVLQKIENVNKQTKLSTHT